MVNKLSEGSLIEFVSMFVYVCESVISLAIRRYLDPLNVGIQILTRQL
jgi:hypothetical protein